MLETTSEILMALDSADGLLMILQSMFNGEIERSFASDRTVDDAITGIRTILSAVHHSIEAGIENV